MCVCVDLRACANTELLGDVSVVVHRMCEHRADSRAPAKPPHAPNTSPPPSFPFPPSPPPPKPSLPLQAVCCDPDRLRGVLLNLYTNAAKFTKRGHIVLRVRCVGRDYTPPAPGGYHAIMLQPSYLPSSSADRWVLWGGVLVGGWSVVRVVRVGGWRCVGVLVLGTRLLPDCHCLTGLCVRL